MSALVPESTRPGRKCWPVLNGAVPPHRGPVLLGWPVRTDCPASTHNTVYASRRPRVRRCLCPRSVQLQKERAMQDRETRLRHRVNPSQQHVAPETLARNVDIWHLVNSDGWTYEQAGDAYGLSKQRVSRIVRDTFRRQPDLKPREGSPGATVKATSGRTEDRWYVQLPEELVQLDATQAACRVRPLGGRKDPAVVDAAFFPVSKGASRKVAEEQAKTLCRMCPIQGECLILALQLKEPHGVWGGLTPEERRNSRTVAIELRSIPDYEEA